MITNGFYKYNSISVGWTMHCRVGTLSAPVDVTAARQYGVEWYYSGNNYDVTGLRCRGLLVTTDAPTRTALGVLAQASNSTGIDAFVLMGLHAEAMGKGSSAITHMRGALIGTEWTATDTLTNLHVLHVRTHTTNNTGAGSFTTGWGVHIENEAVGGNGQALTSAIRLTSTNLSGGNMAFTSVFSFSADTQVCGVDTAAACNTDGVDSDGAIRMQIADTAYYIPFFNAANTSGSW
jgi:hypothetical protein